MEVGYYSPAFLEKQARALVTMEVLWRADPVRQQQSRSARHLSLWNGLRGKDRMGQHDFNRRPNK